MRSSVPGVSTVIAIIGLVAASAIAAAAPSGAATQDELRLIVTDLVPPLVPNSVKDLADTLGFYSQENLSVEFVRVQQTPSAIAALRAGHGDVADVSVSAVLQLAARDQMRLKAIVAPDKAIPFLIAARSHIRALDGLKGAAFGIGRIGSLDHSLSQRVLSGLGIDPSSLRFVSIGQPNVRAQALFGGRIDATAISEGTWNAIEDKGDLRVLVSREQFFARAPLLNKVNVALDATIEKKRRALEKYVRAIIRASRLFAAEPARWAEAMSKARPDIDRAILSKLAQDFRTSWSVNGGISLAQVAFTTDLEYKGADFEGLRKVAAREWIDTTLIDAVLGELGVIDGIDRLDR